MKRRHLLIIEFILFTILGLSVLYRQETNLMKILGVILIVVNVSVVIYLFRSSDERIDKLMKKK